MMEVFAKRQRAFQKECLGYLRYVLNDHFVLFLLIFLGFLALQYRELLQHFPSNPWPVALLLGLISLLLLFLGQVATYLEKPDKLFLLVKEAQVVLYLKGQLKCSFLVWGLIQSLALLLFLPLFLALGLNLAGFAVLLLGLLAVKWWIFKQRFERGFVNGSLDWDYWIAYEAGRRQGLLRFFALFTQVKGISNSVKRRAYLDGLTTVFAKKQDKTWQNLYLRSYLRNGDLFALTLRLALLAILTLVFLPQPWVAVGLASLFNYLLLFQLMGLYGAFDYQYLTQLFPLEKNAKIKGLQEVIRLISALILVLEVAFGLLFLEDKQALLLFTGLNALLYLFYLPFKLKRLVDE